MANFTLTITKSDIYEEVAKTTAYIGAKNLDKNGKSLYDQVFVTEADREMLEGFWKDSIDDISVALESILGWQKCESDINEVFCLRVSSLFNESLFNTLESTVFSYVVNKIVAEWCSVVYKDKVEDYLSKANFLLLKIDAIIYTRKRPTR